MNKQTYINYIMSIFTAIVLIAAAGSALAQGQDTITPETPPATDYMTYQGRLLTGGVPANGSYDFEFKVMSSNGTVIQAAQALGVPVTNGIFTARFLLNVATFTTGGGANLSVGVRQLPTDPFITLAPAQPISATPIAFKAHEATNAAFALNASQLNGIGSDQFVLTNDPRLSDTREPAPGSANYIQNQNTATQQIADFNISGSGNASVFNARSAYALDSFFVLSAPGNGNIFAGVGAGSSNTTGADNAIFGRDAGFNNLIGSGNSFFGSGAGKYTTVDGNSFFGKHAGYSNTTGSLNAFVGKSAGFSNTTGKWNTFFGYEAGYSNVVGGENVFIGYSAGRNSTAGSDTFVGSGAGSNTTTGADNAFFGTQTGNQNTTGYNNAFFGSGAGFSNTTGYANTYVGNAAGSANSTGIENVFVGRSAGVQNSGGSSNTFIGTRAGFGANGVPNTSGNWNVAIGADTKIATGVTNSAVIGYQATVSQSNQIVLGSSSQDTLVSRQLRITTLPSGGSDQLCATSITNIVSLCSSSIRFKENVENFKAGLSIVKRLRPVSFNWREGGLRDVGFIAEEVAEVEPLLASRDEHGAVQGVKYDRITTALVNGVNEQQTQLDRQNAYIKGLQMLTQSQEIEMHKLQAEIEALKSLVCTQSTSAEMCKGVDR